MGIDAVGGAGHQCAVILTLHDLQRSDFLRLHDEDLIHFIGQHLVQNAQQEDIPLSEFVQVGEHLALGRPR